MAGALRKTMLYLGLAEDDRAEHAGEEYVEEYEEEVEMPREYEAAVTPIRATTSRVVAHPASDLRRISTVHPRSYSDARLIGEAFRTGIPVIMNLSDLDEAEAKRLVDFAAGLIFGLHGTLERVTNKVFLLSPAHVEVTGEEAPKRRDAAGFYNPS